MVIGLPVIFARHLQTRCSCCSNCSDSQGRNLCKNVGGSKLQSAREMKILNSAVTQRSLLKHSVSLHNWGDNKCRQLLIAIKPLFVLNVLHNSMNDS